MLTDMHMTRGTAMVAILFFHFGTNFKSNLALVQPCHPVSFKLISCAIIELESGN